MDREEAPVEPDGDAGARPDSGPGEMPPGPAAPVGGASPDECPPGYRSGFVGIVGRPNVGKSTMLNHFLGDKIAITSFHPQTTRRRILGVLTRPDAQVLFLDTPGMHEPKHALGRAMVEATKAVLDDADVLVQVIDARAGLREADEWVAEHVGRAKKPALAAINKVDLVAKPTILPLIDACRRLGVFEAYIPVSAKTGVQMGSLLGEIVGRLPEGPRWYEPAQRTDVPLRELIAELVREQALAVTREEVPHAVAVLIEQMEEGPNVLEIRAAILVERQGQKAIMIGREGAKLKAIGEAARREIERLLGRHIYLGLWVKVEEGWRSDARLLRELGYLS
ncbi:MAG TPA: GTPase Era [bacterium]